MGNHIWYLGKCVYCECPRDSAEATSPCLKRKRALPDSGSSTSTTGPSQRRIEYPRGGD